MAKFLDKKQQVMDFQLTPYGKYKLGIGKFRPTYYAFYDSEVLYDKKYAQSGSDGWESRIKAEPQQKIHDRIKKNTSYLTSLVAFEDLELSVPPSKLIEETVGDVTDRLLDRALDFTDSFNMEDAVAASRLLAQVAYDPTTAEKNRELHYFALDTGEFPRQDIPKPDIYRFGQPIGDSRFDGPSQQNVPSWKVALLQGNVSSSTPINKLHQEERIPQLNTKLIYKKRINDLNSLTNQFDPTQVSEVISTTPSFAGDGVISLIRDDLLSYIEEVNTELLTENFDISVYKIEEVNAVPAIGEIFIKATSDNSNCIQSGSTISIHDGIKSQTFKFTDSGDPAPVTGIQVIRHGRDPTGKCKTNAQNLRNAIRDSGLNVTVSYSPAQGANPPYQHIKITNNYERTSHLFTNRAIGTGGSSGTSNVFTNGGNFVKGFVSGAAKKEILHPKKFARVRPQIVDGFMKFPNVADTQMFGDSDPLTLTTASVEYYFDILTDSQVDQKQACRGAKLFNKDSYYIDLEFDCEEDDPCEDDENLFYDIYGTAMADPEICED